MIYILLHDFSRDRNVAEVRMSGPFDSADDAARWGWQNLRPETAWNKWKIVDLTKCMQNMDLVKYNYEHLKPTPPAGPRG